MNIDPLSTALKEIRETRDLVETLITSSESFDYFGAKVALKDLNRKLRDLSKLQAKLEVQQKTRLANIYVVDFKASVPAPTAPSGM